MTSTASIATKIYAYVDDRNKKDHTSKYKITGYIERPEYEHFNEYNESTKYGTTYNLQHHQKILEKWKNDLNITN